MHNQKSVNDPQAADADWRLWCRLCAKEDPENNINIFLEGEHLDGHAVSVDDVGLVDAVSKYFRVDITSIDELPKMLCTECVSRVTSMVNFSERVSKVQQMFWSLKNSHHKTKLYLQSFRLKYNLLDEQHEHVFYRQLPEVHYVEEKPIIGDFEANIYKKETTAKNPLEPKRISMKIKKNELLSNENVDNYYDVDPDYMADGEIAQSKLEGTTRKRKQRNKMNVLHQEEKSSMSSKKRQCQTKIKPTKRNDTLPKCSEHTPDSKDDNMRHFEGETQSETDCNDDCLLDVIQYQLPEVHYVDEKPINGDLEDTIFKTDRPEKNPLEPGRNSMKTNKEKKTVENVSDLGDGHIDFVNETGFERDEVVHESFEQKTFERIARKRNHIIKVSVSQLKEKMLSSKNRNCKAKEKYKTTKSNDTLLNKSFKNTKVSKYDDVEKLAASTNNCINLEDKTETESDENDDEDFVPPKFIKEKGKESQKEVKVRKRAKKIKGASVCEVCKKVFQTHSILRKHKEIHDPNKHTCHECGLQLNTRATFKDHMLVHSDEMKFKCDFCGRPFKRRNTMMMHRRLHSGLRPYLCEFCGRTFPTSVNCRTHKTLAHRKELAAIEASSESKTMQNVDNQYTKV